MIAETLRGNGADLEVAVALGRAIRERRGKLRRLVRAGIGQVQAAIMGGHPPIRSMVATLHVDFARHLAEADALIPAIRERRLQEEFAEELATLEALGAWPEGDDDLELALRFQVLAPVLLSAIDREERDLLETARNDLVVDDPFGC